MKINYTLLLLIILLLGNRSANSQPNKLRIDSLEAVLQAQTQADTNRVKTLLTLAKTQYMSQPREATARANEGLLLAQQLKFVKGEALGHFQVGVFAFERGEFKAATEHMNASLVIAERRHDLKKTGQIQNVLASICGQQGKFSEAVDLFIKCLKNAEQTHNQEGQVRAVTNIGVTLERMLDEKEAIRYFQRGLAMVDTVKDKPMYSTLLSSLANAYLVLENEAKARPYIYRALQVAGAIGDAQNEGYMHQALGELAAKPNRQDWQTAIAQLSQALQLGEKIGDAALTNRSLIALGNVAQRQGKSAQAFDYYHRALGPAKEMQVYLNLEDIYEGLARTYADIGQYEKAFKNRTLQAIYSDSAKREKFVSEAQNLRAKYDAERKEAQNRLQASQLRVQQQIIRRRNTQLIAGLAVTVLLAGLGYMLYTRRRLQQQVELQQERQQLERLRASAVLEAEEAERRRIGSDLHDGVGQLLTAAKLNLHALSEQLGAQTEGPQTMLQNALDVVDESFREVRSISHNLMPNALIKRGLALAVRDFLSKISPDDRLKIQLEVVGLDRGGRLDPTVENVLFRVIQELAQNIVKHAQATEMTLQIIRSNDELTIMVEDNGVGFDPAALGKDAGIGLKNIESRMAYLGGRADFDAAPGRGTTVILELPLAASQA